MWLWGLVIVYFLLHLKLEIASAISNFEWNKKYIITQDVKGWNWCSGSPRQTEGRPHNMGAAVVCAPLSIILGTLPHKNNTIFFHFLPFPLPALYPACRLEPPACHSRINDKVFFTKIWWLYGKLFHKTPVWFQYLYYSCELSLELGCENVDVYSLELFSTPGLQVGELWGLHDAGWIIYQSYSYIQLFTGVNVLSPANTTRWNNDVLMLAQRLRRWPNIKTSLFQRFVFAGSGCPWRFLLIYNPAYTRGCINVGLMLVQRRRRWANVKPTLIQRLESPENVV